MSAITDYCRAFANGEIDFERLRQLMRQVKVRPYGWDKDQWDYKGYPEENPWTIDYTAGELQAMLMAGLVTLEQWDLLQQDLLADPLPTSPDEQAEDSEVTDGTVAEALEARDEDSVAPVGDTPLPPTGVDPRLDELAARLRAATGSGTLQEAGLTMEASNVLYDLGRLDEALALAMRGRELFQALGDHSRTATATMEIGLIQMAHGWNDEAIASFLAAKKTLEVDDPQKDLAAVCLNLGNALKRAHRPREALPQYEVAHRLYDGYGDQTGAASSIFNLATVYMSLGRYHMALDGFRIARNAYGRLELPAKVIDCDLAAADTLFLMESDEAMPLALDALQRYEELELPVEVANACTVVAHMADHLGQPDLARSLTVRALDFYLEAGMWPDAVHAATILAYVESFDGDPDASIEALETARRISKEKDLSWDDEFDRRMTEQIRTGTLETHQHPNPTDVADPDSIADELFVDAVRIAIELHGSQRRKTTDGDPPPTPYVGHILSVAGHVIDAGGTRDQAIAALFHDAVEDTATTIGDIRALFGDKVAAMVDVCTDAHEIPKPGYRRRKQQFLDRLETTGETDALLVVAADKLHNAMSMLRDHRVVGDRLWDRFNPDADHKWYYGEVARIIGQRLDNPIAADLRHAVDHLDEILKDKE